MRNEKGSARDDVQKECWCLFMKKEDLDIKR